jgi:hypothetical protein
MLPDVPMEGRMTQLSIDPLQDAVAWSQKNPEAWSAVVEWAHADRANGTSPSTRLYCCLLRRPHFAALLGLRRCSASVLIDDHLSSNMARLLNRTYPDLKCPTRDAAADRWAS